MAEVAVSAAGVKGWEGVGFLATGVLNFDMSNFLFAYFSFSGAEAGGLVRDMFCLSPSKSGPYERVLSFAFLLLSSSAISLPCIFMILLVLFLSFCLALSQSSSEDQSECIDGDIGAGLGWWFTCVLKGVLWINSLDVDSVLDVLHGPQGIGAGRLVRTEAVRVAVEAIVVVVGHMDAAVEGIEHPMSSFLYFLLLFGPDLPSLTVVKGLELLFSWLLLLSSS